MFGLTMGPGMSLGFPDVCTTPAVPPVPVPYPNMAQSSATAPVVPNVLFACTPCINMASKGMVSVGDQAGALMGVASGIVGGQTSYNVGCFTINVGGAPLQRLTSVTGQNCMGVMPNCPGVCIAPSQTGVLTLG